MNRSRMLILAVALAGLLSNLGCSSLPTAPVLTSERAATASGGLLGIGSEQITLPPVTLPPVPNVEDSTKIEVDQVVVGAVGGHISAGKVSLDFPRNAFSGAAQVKITIPDSTKLHCRLEITAGKNGFDQPVILRFDASRQNEDVRTLGVYWHNEQTGEWELVESTGDPETGIVQALLSHFSEYRVDVQFRTKAGW